MELEITKDYFEKVVYVATSSNSEVYDAVLPYIENLYPQMEQVLMSEGIAAMESDEYLQTRVKNYLCERGFCDAIRHLTLTLTTAGFGVVSNDHVAPASSDKIDALERALWRAADRDYSLLVAKLISVSGWGAKAGQLVNRLVWDIFMAQDKCGIAEIEHKDWVVLQRHLYDAQYHISFAISFEMVDELKAAMLQNNATDIQKQAILLLQQAICDLTAPVADQQKPVNGGNFGKHDKIIMSRVVNFFEKNADSFPTYVASSEYEARHAERYENTKDSTAYFFG